ncbi:hypothetical protein FB451DRAFT_200278 [Mycena latifolia]|nr:hypothetical protein FB451DRAFT_200278 [Mycena latifolia]
MSMSLPIATSNPPQASSFLPTPASASGSAPPATGNTAVTKARTPRVGFDGVKLMLNFFNDVSRTPSLEECTTLLAKINALPGEGNQGFTLHNLQQWFLRQKRPKRPKSTPTSASTPAPASTSAAAAEDDKRNPAYPSLDKAVLSLLAASWTITSAAERPRLYDTWIRSGFYHNLHATQADIRAWIAEREAQEGSDNVNPHSNPNNADPNPNPNLNPNSNSNPNPNPTPLPTPQPTPDPNANAPPLHVDTALPVSADAPYAYGMPTPSDTTTSPEPQWAPAPTWRPSSLSRAASRGASPQLPHYRYRPYMYEPPTPPTSAASMSSRAPSLALKSEPANSPPISTLASLPPLHASTSTSAHAPAPAYATASPAAPAPASLPPHPQPQPIPMDIDTEPTPPPPEEPKDQQQSYGRRILEQLKRDMEEETLHLPVIECPRNYAEFDAAFKPWETKMEDILEYLKNVNREPLPPTG